MMETKVRKSNRSFTWFMVSVIFLMVLTGVVAFFDLWSGEVVEQTATGEERQLMLPSQTVVQLAPETDFRFDKGDDLECRLFRGGVKVDLPQGGLEAPLVIETRDLELEAKTGSFSLEIVPDSTRVASHSSRLHLELKPQGKVWSLEPGEVFTYSRD